MKRREFLGVKPPKVENSELYDCIKKSESMFLMLDMMGKMRKWQKEHR